MDQQPPHENLSSYYHPQHHHHHSPVAASPTNGLLPPSSAVASTDMGYPHSAPSAAASAPVEKSKRKRGRPRKYGTPEQALAAKKATASSHRERREQQGFGGSSSPPPSSSYSGPSSRKSQLPGLGNAGQGFTPHVIGIAAGEDAAQKIMLFMQQSKREICILSASGSISSASLRQPATSGGNITYEGRFEIITLSGSYVHTELGGRTGGLSICLSDTSGQIIGGGVGGPLVAAGPVQVIIGSFSVNPKRDTSTSVKGDPSGKLPSPVGGSAASSGGFRAAGINLSSPSHYMVQTGARM